MLVFAVSANASEIIDRGQCGDNLTWTLDDEGTLIISGIGDMWDWNYGSSPWYNNVNIKSVKINNGATSIGACAFRACDNLTDITIPSSITNIKDNAFSYCKNLPYITIPSSVTSIGNYVFDNCHGLLSVALSDSITTIANGTFSNCNSLTSITIPNGIISIEDYAFSKCSSLTSISMPATVTDIGNRVFDYCSRLASIDMPDNVTRIGSNAFYDTAYYRNEENWEDGILYIDNYLIRANSTTINSECSIKANTKIIADHAFGNCSNLTGIIIPQGVTNIGDRAFYCCTGLNYISIPASVTDIHESAFERCDKLAEIEVAFDNDIYLSDNNVLINKDKGLLIFYPREKTGGYIIPDGITYICDNAFYNCKYLTSIYIPDSVTAIGNDAFEGCSSLTEVSIPDSVTDIGYGVFSGCMSLKTVGLPQYITEINVGMFHRCSALQEITIPDNVTIIERDAFCFCSSLNKVQVPDSVVEIGSYAFESCSELYDIEIPDSIMRVGDGILVGTPYYYDENNWEDGILYYDDIILDTQYGYTFENNYRIKDGIRIIAGAFSGQKDLKTVTFPESLEAICGGSFMYTDIDNIIFEGDMVSLIPMENYVGIPAIPFNAYYERLGSVEVNIYYPSENLSYNQETMDNFGYYDVDDGMGGPGRWIVSNFYPYYNADKYICTTNSALDISEVKYAENNIWGISKIDVTQLDQPIDTNETIAIIAFYDGTGNLISISTTDYIEENDTYKLNIAPNCFGSEFSEGKLFLWNRDTLTPAIEAIDILKI